MPSYISFFILYIFYIYISVTRYRYTCQLERMKDGNDFVKYFAWQKLP